MGIELIRFDMSEYMERHAVSRLIGAPPGYVGFDQGGLLTEAITKKPHAVLLLTKSRRPTRTSSTCCCRSDHGTLTDNNGRKADFRNVLIIMTTNAGAETMNKATIGFTNRARRVTKWATSSACSRPSSANRLDAIVNFKALDEQIILRGLTSSCCSWKPSWPRKRWKSPSPTPCASTWPRRASIRSWHVPCSASSRTIHLPCPG